MWHLLLSAVHLSIWSAHSWKGPPGLVSHHQFKSKEMCLHLFLELMISRTACFPKKKMSSGKLNRDCERSAFLSQGCYCGRDWQEPIPLLGMRNINENMCKKGLKIKPEASAIWCTAGNGAEVERGPGIERVAFTAALNKNPFGVKKSRRPVSFPSFSTSSNRCFIIFKAIFKNVSVKNVHKSPVSDISLDVYLGVCCFYRCQHSELSCR